MVSSNSRLSRRASNQLIITASGFQQKTISLTLREAQKLDQTIQLDIDPTLCQTTCCLVVTALYGITGTVASSNGKRLPDAIVSLFTSTEPPRTVRSARDGSFTFSEVPCAPQPARVTVAASRHASAERRLTDTCKPTEIHVTLSPVHRKRD